MLFLPYVKSGTIIKWMLEKDIINQHYYTEVLIMLKEQVRKKNFWKKQKANSEDNMPLHATIFDRQMN